MGILFWLTKEIITVRKYEAGGSSNGTNISIFCRRKSWKHDLALNTSSDSQLTTYLWTMSPMNAYDVIFREKTSVSDQRGLTLTSTCAWKEHVGQKCIVSIGDNLTTRLLEIPSTSERPDMI
jgi:hypothetical protein